jgi:probable HAF family extracellular repeat protein
MLEYFGGIDRAYDINSSGQVTGSATDPTRSLGRQAYLHADGVTTSLGTLGGKTSKGTALNESGHVVGYADLAEQYVTHAFMYKDGAMQDLGTLGGKISRAYAVNAHGDVAGFSTDAAYNTRSFLYTNGAMQELEMFGGLDSWAQGINDNGIVVGYAFSGDDVRAYRHADGLAFDLGSLGGSSSAAFAVNNAGAIVGYSTLGSNQDAGFLWEGGKMYDLNALIGRDLGWTIRAGLDINSRGQILVDACHVDTGCNALLLTPNEVPEPSTPATLLAAALAMFGGLALRRTLGK